MHWQHAMAKWANYAPHHHGKHHGRHHGGGNFRRAKYNIPANVAETDTHYEIHLYALGYDKANISITVVDDVLYVSGTREIPEDYRPNFIRQEFPIKSFEKEFHLNDGIDTTGIVAKQEEGVLIITLPKKVEAQRQERKVDIG
ncbi:MAG TPA: Hsp20/alpha crystallin family protein [Haliscomenobacter sp.]|uniref:Hsp20/alpha crystallin family protein n=1 Tax=Haliscomenobacter sp. TaxID=2717303 RepID=UPI002C85A1D7|nr:Hsp20/alpha crystallin family protein [Haliscomenobacter sp.]HOY18213.1 Hsp20/alpha crystallin family protein [Haliscomenobacter sp.]HPH20558.1 Hsp20/alpha crystallin family protein [Haliscomenobacter sp.]